MIIFKRLTWERKTTYLKYHKKLSNTQIGLDEDRTPTQHYKKLLENPKNPKKMKKKQKGRKRKRKLRKSKKRDKIVCVRKHDMYNPY
jgi:hypothetical protein